QLTVCGLSLTGTAVMASAQQVEYDKELNTPAHIAGIWETAEGISKEEAVYLLLQNEVLQSNENSISGSVEKQIEKAKNQFKIVDKKKDNKTDTEHLRTVETYNGVPIYG